MWRGGVEQRGNEKAFSSPLPHQTPTPTEGEKEIKMKEKGGMMVFGDKKF